MKKSLVLGAVTLAAMSAGSVFAGTADDVKARGTLNCGVSTGVPGFAQPDADGTVEPTVAAVDTAPAPAQRLRDADDERCCGRRRDALLRGRVEELALFGFVFLLVEDAVVEERLGGS